MTNPERIAKGLYWDRAWTLVRGCTPVSEGCDNCWSAKETHMRQNNPNLKIQLSNMGLTESGKFNGKIRTVEANLDLLSRTKNPKVWAVWNDLFHEDVSFDFVCDVLARVEFSPQHTVLVLTKRPERMLEFFQTWENRRWPLPNLWLGVTAENQACADERIPILLQIPAAVRFVSVEPMLGAVDLNERELLIDKRRFKYTIGNYLDWVICGGETGPGARSMQIEWVQNLKDQCVVAGVPFFLKQMHMGGKMVKMPELDGMVWDEMPEPGRGGDHDA